VRERASLTTSRMGMAPPFSWSGLANDIAISINGKVTGSPTLDVVGGVCRLQGSQSFFRPFFVQRLQSGTIVDPAKHCTVDSKKNRLGAAIGSGERAAYSLPSGVWVSPLPKHEHRRQACRRLQAGKPALPRNKPFPLSVLQRHTRSWEQLVFRPSISTVNTGGTKRSLRVHVQLLMSPTSGEGFWRAVFFDIGK